MRIYGLGNEDRGDDAAGLLVARRLRAAGLDACELAGDPMALVDAWRGLDAVALVDAVVTGAPVGTIYRWNARSVQAAALRASTHGFTLVDAYRLGENLGTAPATVVVFGIEGACFDGGIAPGAAVLAAVDRLVERLEAAHVISCSAASHES